MGHRAGGGEWVLPGISLVVLILPFFLTPNVRMLGTHTQLGLPPCIFHALTSLPCPFCGATTSFTLLVRGRFVEAWQANPWGPLIYLALMLFCVFSLVSTIRNRRIKLEINLSFWGLSLLFIILWVGKLWVWWTLR